MVHVRRSLLALAAVLAMTACGPGESAQKRREEANTPAGKAGKAAYHVGKASGKALKAAGREVGKAAHQAREGWKEASREQKAKSSK